MIIAGPIASEAEGYRNLIETIQRELNRLNYNPPDIELLVDAPHNNTNADIHFTMWESTSLFPVQVALLNSRKLVIVPNKQDKADFIANGVTTPIEICPLYATGKFAPFMPIRPLRFLHVGSEYGIPDRKRHQDMVWAFQNAFPVQPDIELVIKRTKKCSKLHAYDSRITVIDERLTNEQMHALYSNCHVGLFPGGMESWCLPATELAATGRASIVPLWRGPADIFDQSNAFPATFTMMTTPAQTYHNYGQMAHITQDGLITAMRYAYNNPIEVYKRGLAAAQRATEFTPERFGVRLRDILHNYGCQSGNKLVTRVPPNDRPMGAIHAGDRSAAQVGVTDNPIIRLA